MSCKGVFRDILKNIDFFSVPFHFTYKKEDNYTTRFGGIIMFIYILIIIIYLIYRIIPFFNRKNYEFIYYQNDKDKTDILHFNESNVLAFKLDFKDVHTNLTSYDLFKVEIKYIYSRPGNDSRIKDPKIPINTYNCEYNSTEKKFTKVSESQYKCLNFSDLKNYTNIGIQNGYNDEFFTYFEIEVKLSDSRNDNFTEVTDYLIKNDCKFEFFYLDYSIKVENFSKPIIPYKNSVFLQFNPISILQMNIFFMKQKLKEKNNILFLLDKEKTTENIIFSRLEQYSYYKGENRAELNKKFNDSNYKTYAKIFVRADTRELEVQRKYQNLPEFWADNSSLFFDIFTLFNLIFSHIYKYLSYISLSKKLFYFIDFEKNNFNFYPNKSQLKEEVLDKINKKEQNNDLEIPIEEMRNEPFETEPNRFGNNNQPCRRKQQYNKMKSFFNCIYYNNYSKACEIISEQLDIVAYIRNNMLLNLINNCLFGSNRKEIIKLLSIPVISLDNKNEDEEDNIFSGKTDKYKEYSEEDFKKCQNEIDKQEKENNFDNKFNSYVKEYLEKILKIIKE